MLLTMDWTIHWSYISEFNVKIHVFDRTHILSIVGSESCLVAAGKVTLIILYCWLIVYGWLEWLTPWSNLQGQQTWELGSGVLQTLTWLPTIRSKKSRCFREWFDPSADFTLQDSIWKFIIDVIDHRHWASQEASSVSSPPVYLLVNCLWQRGVVNPMRLQSAGATNCGTGLWCTSTWSARRLDACKNKMTPFFNYLMIFHQDWLSKFHHLCDWSTPGIVGSEKRLVAAGACTLDILFVDCLRLGGQVNAMLFQSAGAANLGAGLLLAEVKEEFAREEADRDLDVGR